MGGLWKCIFGLGSVRPQPVLNAAAKGPCMTTRLRGSRGQISDAGLPNERGRSPSAVRGAGAYERIIGSILPHIESGQLQGEVDDEKARIQGVQCGRSRTRHTKNGWTPKRTVSAHEVWFARSRQTFFSELCVLHA